MKTAANYFQVLLDTETTSVIVPYGAGADIIADLNGSLTIEECQFF
ncbi:hypothetical protein KHA80_04205 [Anaerobacillus sp. HL2]|nr:hypothetical protein KHA80_04205 [Anaerobacillus sp. HL2]